MYNYLKRKVFNQKKLWAKISPTNQPTVTWAKTQHLFLRPFNVDSMQRRSKENILVSKNWGNTLILQ
jgi:hypothetical protein